MTFGRFTKTAVYACALIALGACAKAKHAVEAALAGDDTPYTPPPGKEATQFLAPTGGVAPTDPQALASALALAADDAAKPAAGLADDDAGSADDADTATINLLKQGAGAKEGIATGSFKLPSPASLKPTPSAGLADFGLTAFGLGNFDTQNTPKDPLDPTAFNPLSPSDPVSLDAGKWGNKTELMISRVGNIPVRDQGSRGTCAAHTGTALLEYTILKKYASKLSTIQLSPQRFYMISKQDLWDDGGKVDADGGSAWGNGYEMSFGLQGVTVPSADQKYNIPLEADCPYNPESGANELQLPMPIACEHGAVRVSSLSETFYTTPAGKASATKTWYSSAPQTAQQIFDRLVQSDLPVPIAANITANFMDNDGMITQAGSVGQSSQGGHAFLIVGARKIDEAKFPGEGGMCFVVKNSWGLGWGVNGYSCMTLAWWNNHREATPSDLAFDVDVDLDYVLSKTGLTAPGAAVSLLDGSTEALPVQPVTLASTPDNPGLAGQAAADTGTPAASVPVVAPAAAPAPAPAPAPVPETPSAPAPAPVTPTPAGGTPGQTADGYTVVGLVTPNGGIVKALYKADATANTIAIEGVLADDKTVTQPLTLPYDPGTGTISFDDPTKGEKVVGTLANNQMNLCAQQYAEVCVLNLVQPDNTLVVGLTQGAWDDYAPDPNASYTSLVAFGGYGIDAAIGDGAFADIRLVLGGVATNPLRFKVDPIEGGIKYKGKDIGNYQKAELCSGADFKNICRFVINSDTHDLSVFFKAAK